jgi:putative ABC transport system permease protein
VRGKSSFLRFDDVEPWRVHVDGIRDLSPVFVPGFSEVRDTSNTNPACSPGCG